MWPMGLLFNLNSKKHFEILFEIGLVSGGSLFAWLLNISATKYMVFYLNKRPSVLYGQLSIRDSTLTSCQKCSYLYINSPIIE